MRQVPDQTGFGRMEVLLGDPTMKKILVVDDNIDVGGLIKVGLKDYFVHQAFTLVEAEQELEKVQYDLVLIDITLPDGSGSDLCLRLKDDLIYRNIPKIILTANRGIADKIYGFTCGADDYITKPFHLLELKARVDRYFQQSPEKSTGELVFGCFSFDPAFQKCHVIDETGSKQDLLLTPTEFRLFLTLAKGEGEVLSRHVLERATWGPRGTNIQSRGIDTHISHLRGKLGPRGDMIVAVYGQGYCFKYKSSDQAAA